MMPRSCPSDPAGGTQATASSHEPARVARRAADRWLLALRNVTIMCYYLSIALDGAPEKNRQKCVLKRLVSLPSTQDRLDEFESRTRYGSFVNADDRRTDMPNWHTNYVAVMGEPEALKKIPADFDFQKICPMPEVLKGTTAPMEVVDTQAQADEINARCPGKAITVDEAAERFRRYGAINWYAWSLAHWGSKWPASNVEEDMGLETSEGASQPVSVRRWSFETPWAPPYALYRKLEEKYGVSVYAVDYDEDFQGVFGYGDPEIVSRLFTVDVAEDVAGYPEPDVWFTSLEETELADLAAAHGSPCPQDLRGWEVHDDSVD